MAHERTDLLDFEKIMANLTTERIGGKVLIYDSTSSTNDVAAEYAKIKQNDGLVIFAEEQTAGRGRTGNKWLSGRADSILCSIVLVENKINVELLSLTCAVAVAEAIGKPGRSQAKIKWPNDIMLNGKKVAGILLESKKDNGGSIYIVGIGINCHQTKESFAGELQQIATSIDAESHSISDRNLLAKRLLVSVGQWLKMAANNSEKVIARWRQLSIQLGHRVSLIFDGAKFTGHCIGIDPEKGLILQLDTGGVRMFNAAHSSIAK
ncbi:MAG: biotin--[acetyl-CoA-carboxylase] ligase [Planctomycetota bacterium]|jgi:BirA family biotin operon repressor/biotin-[acetyl-CoA-carboxylase] ligase